MARLLSSIKPITPTRFWIAVEWIIQGLNLKVSLVAEMTTVQDLLIGLLVIMRT